jgi:nitroreductase
MEKVYMGIEDNYSPVLGRRSIRRFTGDPVSETQLHTLIEAAMCAPSADDERPWHFVAIRDLSIRLKLAEVSPATHIIKDGQLAIVVCGDDSLQKQQGCWTLDCAAATENILIEAHFIGLGAVWLGVYPVEGRIQRIRNILVMPQNIVPFSIVAVGYPAEHKEFSSRYDERRLHLERWIVKKPEAV